jgi:hypothetical protein
MPRVSPAFRVCVHPIHREHAEAARRALARHGAVVEGSVSYDGERIVWHLDLGRLPPGDGPSVEAVIVRAIEAEARR